ncbi:pheromone processing endoprotease, partial [Irineochytrium annulatum]
MSHGFTFLGQIGDLEGHYLLETEAVDAIVGDALNSSTLPAKRGKNRLQKRSVQEVDGMLLDHEHVGWFERQKPKRRAKRVVEEAGEVGLKLEAREARSVDESQEVVTKVAFETAGADVTSSDIANILGFEDPKFYLQWHLFNDGTNGIYRGHDINVLPVWKRGINGTGVTVSIIDDGVEYSHDDFANGKWSTESSYDFNERTNTPLPQSADDSHGTRCAAERLIAESTTDAVEAQALNYKNQINDIYSSSWGPNDDGASLDGPGYLANNALVAGIERGRGGKGSIFVFASGNGGIEGDNCNFDGMRLQWTTDVGGQCTGLHSGTSAAAPIASGIIALMLSSRPELGWRDVQHLIVDTAQMTDASDADWTRNGAGRFISHKYGFGLLNAELLVNRSITHNLLPPTQLIFSKASNPNLMIPLSTAPTQDVLPQGVTDTVEITSSALEKTGLALLEHVEVTLRLRHPARRHLTITLTSPSGTQSILAAPRYHDDSTEGFNPWTFMTVR